MSRPLPWLLLVLLLTAGACDDGAPGREDPEPAPAPRAAPLSEADVALVLRAERALGAERPAEVAGILAPLLAREPPPPRALFLSGWAAYQMQQYGECVELLERALAADPGLTGQVRVLGFAHYKLGDHEQARDVFARYLEARSADQPEDQPDDYRAHYGLGLSELALGRHDQARPSLERALELQPAYAKAHYALARLHAEQGRPAEALPHVSFVLQREPHHVEALYLLSQVQKDLGDSAAATATLERWQQAYATRERVGPLQQQVRQGLASADVFLVLAGEHARLGDTDQAAAALREGLHRFPGDPRLAQALAALQAGDGG